MSTYNVDDDDSNNHIPFKTKYVCWVKEITGVRRQFERMMRIVMDYQTEFIFDRNNMKSNPGYEELFNDNTILLADTLTNLIKIEKELIYERQTTPKPISTRNELYDEVIGGASNDNHNPPASFTTIDMKPHGRTRRLLF